MGQRNVHFLEPQELNATRQDGTSAVFDAEDSDPLTGRLLREGGYFQSVFAEMRCTWEGCGALLPDRGIPLCHEHAARIWAYVEHQEANGTHIIARQKLLEELKAEEARKAASQRQRITKHRETVTAPGHVYYLRVGDLIKIGFTTDLWRRMNEYPPNVEKLATHPGTMQLEMELHSRFQRHRARGREWYYPHEDLMAHIATVVEDERQSEEQRRAESPATILPLKMPPLPQQIRQTPGKSSARRGA